MVLGGGRAEEARVANSGGSLTVARRAVGGGGGAEGDAGPRGGEVTPPRGPSNARASSQASSALPVVAFPSARGPGSFSEPARPFGSRGAALSSPGLRACRRSSLPAPECQARAGSRREASRAEIPT